MNNNIWVENIDCIKFLKKLPDKSIDLILTDPPFGINEKQFDNIHYSRNQKLVIDGYCEAPKKIDYEKWCFSWIKELDRVLKDNASCFIFSSWNNVAKMENAINQTKKFKIINHLIWHYNFGVFTKNKFVSSHYHILFFSKIKSKRFFNNNINNNLFNTSKMIYNDLQDVIKINKEFHKNKIKNANKLPDELIKKLILHTTKKNDVVLDIFSGNFTTQIQALKLGRKAWGSEINKKAFELAKIKLKYYGEEIEK